jgi:hypothetical protein
MNRLSSGKKTTIIIIANFNEIIYVRLYLLITGNYLVSLIRIKA